jgi:AraC-like DNA-binding protein
MAEAIKEMTKSLTQPRRLAKLPARKPSLKAARELLSHVAAVGGNIPALLQRAGLPPSAINLLEKSRKTPIDRDHFARLFAEATWVLDAHECIREGRMPLTKSEIDLLCYCVITCRNLREVIARTIDFSAMLMPRMSRLTMQNYGDQACLQMHTIRSAREASAFVSDLTGLATFYRLFAWLIGEDIRPLSAELCYAQMLSAETVARILPCPITYDAPDNRLSFPAHLLEKPVIRSYVDLQSFLPHFPFDPDARLTATASLSDRIFHHYVAALADERPLPLTEDFAKNLSISPATLRRRLADEGLSLSHLRDKARQQAAERLLRHSDLSLETISAHIQFTDVASFSRAFTRWTGQSPGRWRTHPDAVGQKVRSI